jgi:hypothetical protein
MGCETWDVMKEMDSMSSTFPAIKTNHVYLLYVVDIGSVISS